jgi:hypothetical protein
MIDGLKVLVPGHELKKMLEGRVRHHLARAAHWKREEQRLPEEATKDELLLPEHICANEAASHRWRADVLSFFRDRIDVADSYRLGEEDLEFAGLLPERPNLVGPVDDDDDVGASHAVDQDRLTPS